MKTLLPILLFFCLASANAQCRGIDDTIYPDQIPKMETPKLKWYDFSTYKFKGGGKRAVWIGYAVAGILHGGREAYHAEPTVLQNVFGGADDSWIGPMQWLRQYPNRDPDLPHKPNIWNPIRDYYHFSGAATKAVWIGGAFTVGMSRQPMKYKLLDLLIGTLITSGTASLTYNILR